MQPIFIRQFRFIQCSFSTWPDIAFPARRAVRNIIQIQVAGGTAPVMHQDRIRTREIIVIVLDLQIKDRLGLLQFNTLDALHAERMSASIQQGSARFYKNGFYPLLAFR